MAEPFDDPVYDYLYGSRSAAPTPLDDYDPSLPETFRRGMVAGAEGLGADLNYFAALGNSLIGDEEGVAKRIQAARADETAAADTLGSLQRFDEFWDEPTFDGFMTQIFKGTGQLVPFAITSIAGAGAGALAGVGVKLGTEGTKYAAKKIIKDSLENTAKGIATPEEKDIAEGAFNLAKRARYGAYGGAGISEFAPLSGSNFAEALESGEDPNDPVVAFRAAALGIPQAAIGVGGEALMVRQMAKRAGKLAGGRKETVYGRLSEDLTSGFLKAGTTEAIAETAQEGLAVLNRAEMDDTFTAQDAKLRLAESAFAAFFGGGAFGAAGSTAAGSVREIRNIPDNVSAKARDYLNQGKEAITEQIINNQFLRGKKQGFPDPEPPSAVNAQLDLMFKDRHPRKAVWVAGQEAMFKATETPRKVILSSPSGNREAWVAFVPGKGTIVSPFVDIVEEVVAGNASEDVLQAALGMSGTKPPDADRVVQAFDGKGNEVFSEVTNADGEAGAKVAAEAQRTEEGSTRTVSPEQALSERAEKYRTEVPPEVLENLAMLEEGTRQAGPDVTDAQLDATETVQDAVQRRRDNIEADKAAQLEQNKNTLRDQAQTGQVNEALLSDTEALVAEIETPLSDALDKIDAGLRELQEKKGEPKESPMRQRTIRERVNDVVELIEVLTPRQEVLEGNRQVRQSPRLLASGFFTDLTTGLTFRRVDMQDQERVSSVEEIEAQRRRPEPTPEAPLQAGPELRAQARLSEVREEFGTRLNALAKGDSDVAAVAKAYNKRYQATDVEGKNLILKTIFDMKEELERSLGRGIEDRLTMQDLEAEQEAGQFSEDVEGVEQEVADPTSGMEEQNLRVVFEMSFEQAPLVKPKFEPEPFNEDVEALQREYEQLFGSENPADAAFDAADEGLGYTEEQLQFLEAREANEVTVGRPPNLDNLSTGTEERVGQIKLYPRDMPAARAAFMEEFEGRFSPNWEDGGFWQRMTPAMLKQLVNQRRAGKEVEIDPPGPLNPGRYLITVLSSDAELFRHKPRKKPEQLLTLDEFLLAEVNAAKSSKFAAESGVSITDPDGNIAKVNLVDIISAGKRLLETRLQQDFVAASDGQALMEMFNELIVNGYDISFDLEGRDRAGKKIIKPVSITKQTTFTAKHIVDEDSMATDLEQQTRTRRGAQPNRSQLELFTLDGKAVGEQTTFKSTILRELAAHQQRISRWFVSNSDVDPNDPTSRILRKDANKTRPVAPRYLNPILKTAASSKSDPYLKDDKGKARKIPLRKIISKNLKMSREEDLGTVKRPTSFATVTDANRSYLQDRAEVRLGREILEEDFEAELEKELGIQEGLYEREVAGVPGLDEKGEPEGSGSRLLDESPDVPYAYYDTEVPTVIEGERAKTSLSFIFGEPESTNANVNTVDVVKRMIGTLSIRKPTGVIFASQLDALSPDQIRQRFRDARVADKMIELKDEMAASQGSDLGRAVTYKNSHFILVDDVNTGNELGTALVLAHEIGHLFLNEQQSELLNKPIYRKIIRAFKNRDKSIEGYRGELAFEEWFADQVAKWGSQEFIKSKPKNVVESTFKKIAAKLRAMFKALVPFLQRRFKGPVEVSVETFIEQVVEANRTNNATLVADPASIATWEEKALVKAIREETENTPGAVSFSKNLFEQAKLAINNKVRGMQPLRNVFFTANKNLRMIGDFIKDAKGKETTTRVGELIADMFYREAGARTGGSRMGMLQEADVQNREIEERFRREIGALDSPEVITAMEAASSETPTTQLENELAVKIRVFLEDLHKNYIQPSQKGFGRNQKGRIDFQQNYFPVVLNLQEIAHNGEAFAQLLLRAEEQRKPFASSEDRIKALNAIRKSLARIVKYQDVVENSELNIDEVDPASVREEKRRLTALVSREELIQKGFALPPVEAFMMYKKQLVKRVEWNSSTKSATGTDRLQPLLDQLDAKDRAYAQEIINGYLGYGYEPMSEKRRKWQSRLLAAQYTLLLPFAAIGSLPELAGPIIFSKEFNGFEMAFRQLKQGLSQEEARKMAEEIGLVQDGAISNAWMSVTEREHMDEASRAWTDKYFKYTGLEFFTNFSRSFATGMSVQFLLHHADLPNSRSARYLDSLGVTPAQIKAWDEGGRTFESQEGKAVKFAIQKFVESSILRPNAAERPVWASDPRWALVWQLKSYFYAFYTKIIGGIRREIGIRMAETEGRQRVYGAAGMLALSAVALLPLAMVGMELREYAKTGLAFFTTLGQSEKDYFRTDNMEWGAYLGEALDKTGVYGPLSIVSMAYRSGQWNGPAAGLAALLGPTAESVEAVFGRGEFDRLVPAAAIL